jgi:dihydrofolate synthase/folylpolyglutamate synthase
LLDLLADPHLGYPIIHLAGTNGKTSTARFVAALLAAHGLKPGLFTSPHLHGVEERYEVGLEPMTREQLAAAVAELQPFVAIHEDRTGDGATYFELTTALAFTWFAEQTVDAAVIETGLGGRLDATDVAPADVAVVTTVGRDHVEYLGADPAGIAAEKVAILDEGAELVTGDLDPALLPVMEQRVVETGATWLRYGADFGVDEAAQAVGGWLVTVDGVHAAYEDLRLKVHGRHQTVNLAVAVAAVESLFGRALDPDAVAAAADTATLPGRMEVLGHDPLLLLDGAHNPPGIAALAAALEEEFPTTRWSLVFGAMGDKEVDAMLEPLRPLVDRVYVTAADADRALPATDLAALFTAAGYEAVEVEPTVSGALAAAREAGGPVLVTGSLYVVGEARSAG